MIAVLLYVKDAPVLTAMWNLIGAIFGAIFTGVLLGVGFELARYWISVWRESGRRDAVQGRLWD